MGYEYTHSYRSLLHLADRLARAGIITLRFDFHGNGSSPGDVISGDLTEEWARDVEAASAALLKYSSGRPTIIGLRLGATLAARAATRMPIENFVAWAPVVRGKSYVREQMALDRFAASSAHQDDAYSESAGFVMSRETAASVGTLDLTQMEFMINGEALLLERPDTPAESSLWSALEAQGVKVSREVDAGYGGMMNEPHYTVVPERTIEHVATWVSDRAPRVRSTPHRRANRNGDQRRTLGAVRFEVVEIPGPPSLFGVLTEPIDADRSRRPLLVLTNAGSVHQVGPNQVYAELAGFLAAHGYPTLRLDLRNLGDNIRPGVPEENHPYPSTAVADVASAAAWARSTYGYRDLVVGGLCSGAYTAFRASVELPPGVVTGALVMNPLTFDWHPGLSLDTPSSQTVSDAMQYGASVRSVDKWIKLLKGEANTPYLARFLVRHAAEATTEAVRSLGERLGLVHPSSVAKDLEQLRTRGLRIDFVFSSTDPGYRLLTRAARHPVRRLTQAGLTSITTIQGADHTLSRRRWREELACVVLGTLKKHYPA